MRKRRNRIVLMTLVLTISFIVASSSTAMAWTDYVKGPYSPYGTSDIYVDVRNVRTDSWGNRVVELSVAMGGCSKSGYHVYSTELKIELAPFQPPWLIFPGYTYQKGDLNILGVGEVNNIDWQVNPARQQADLKLEADIAALALKVATSLTTAAIKVVNPVVGWGVQIASMGVFQFLGEYDVKFDLNADAMINNKDYFTKVAWGYGWSNRDRPLPSVSVVSGTHDLTWTFDPDVSTPELKITATITWGEVHLQRGNWHDIYSLRPVGTTVAVFWLGAQ